MAKHEKILLLKIYDSFKPVFYNKELLHCSEGESIDAVFLFTDAALHGPIQAVITVKELPFDILSIIKKKSVLWGIISRMDFETFLH